MTGVLLPAPRRMDVAGYVCQCPSLFPWEPLGSRAISSFTMPWGGSSNVPRQNPAHALCISHHEFQEVTPTSSAPFELRGPPRAQSGRGEEQGRTDLGSAGQAAPVAPELLNLPRTQGSEFFPLLHASPYLSPLEYTLLFIHANKRQALARCFTKNPIKPILTELVPAK